jgi:hypothetical protein
LRTSEVGRLQNRVAVQQKCPSLAIQRSAVHAASGIAPTASAWRPGFRR